jgi:small subunit ribosomal protein S12
MYSLKQFKTLKTKSIIKKIRRKVLHNKPQSKGFILKVFLLNPKKPNSALRPVVRLKTSSFIDVNCHIPGEGHNLQQHSTILIRGCRVRDLPGVNYRGIRGAFDLQGVITRRNGRSKYGAPMPK